MSHFVMSPRSRELRDSRWVRTTFMLAEDEIAGLDGDTQKEDLLLWRLESSVRQKFTNTRLGGNFTINNPPQYTRYADIRLRGLAAKNNQGDEDENMGMGRFYGEQIDDNSQIVHLQFGLPEYNGMLSFFTSFFDNDASIMASEGRGSITYYLGKAIGLVVSVATMVRFPIWVMSGFGYRFIMQKPSSAYYYMVPRMALYWNKVNLIANTIAVNMGLVPRAWNSDTGASPIDTTLPEDDPYMTYAHRQSPEIFDSNGGINVYAVANKAQRMADERYRLILQEAEQATDNTDLLRRMQKVSKQILVGEKPKNMDEYLAEYHKSVIGDMGHRRTDANVDVTEIKAAEQPEGTEGTKTIKPGIFDSLRAKFVSGGENQPPTIQEGYGSKEESGIWDYWIANRREGSDYIAYKVDYTGSVSESFSNSVRESDISQKFNGFSNSNKSLRFTFSEGNTGIDPLDWITGAVTDLFGGIVDGVSMGGFLALAGSAFVDIPKHWDNSSANFPTNSYTIELRTPYGNKLSRYMNLMIPLAGLLAGALPQSTGKKSYTSPMLCHSFCRGRSIIRNGMVTDINITRGVGNMAWTKNGECLGIDVTFTITDLSSVMHMPIDSGSILPWKGLLDDDSAFMDYMGILGNLSLADMTYPSRKLQLNIARKMQQYDTFFSKAHFANALDNFWVTRTVGQLTGLLTRQSERLQGG